MKLGPDSGRRFFDGRARGIGPGARMEFKMGAKAWFIAYSDCDPKSVLADAPVLDRAKSRALAEQLFPGYQLKEESDGALDFLNPDDGKLYVGHFGALRIMAHGGLGEDYPSRIDRKWLEPSLGATAYLHATHSVVDWLAFGLWRNGSLVRALSVSPDNGVQEQIGAPLDFERPYWDGGFPVDVDKGDDPYPLPFHPLELSEASMLANMGFQFEGKPSDWVCDPADIPLMAFSLVNERRNFSPLKAFKAVFGGSGNR